jgi:hypothetical protein
MLWLLLFSAMTSIRMPLQLRSERWKVPRVVIAKDGRLGVAQSCEIVSALVEGQGCIAFREIGVGRFQKPSLQQRLGGCFDGASCAEICGD